MVAIRSRTRRARAALHAAITAGTLATAIAVVPMPAAAQLRLGDCCRSARPTASPRCCRRGEHRTLSFEPDPTDKSAPPRRSEHFASGFIVDASGIVVTNHHAIDGVPRST